MSLLKDIEKLEQSKSNKEDFQKFFVIRKATKTLPIVALMVEGQTEKADDDLYKDIYFSLGVIISEKNEKTFYEANDAIVDEFFNDVALEKPFFKTLTPGKEIKCELESKAFESEPEEIEFDRKVEELIENKGYLLNRVYRRLDDVFFKIYDGKF